MAEMSNIDHAKLENRQIFSMEILTTMQVLRLFCPAVYITGIFSFNHLYDGLYLT